MKTKNKPAKRGKPLRVEWWIESVDPDFGVRTKWGPYEGRGDAVTQSAFMNGMVSHEETRAVRVEIYEVGR